MEKACGVACLVPFYNEGERVMAVLETITRLKDIDRIICIDDGSDDEETHRLIRQRWPDVQVIRLPGNRGKTAAIKEGLSLVESDYVLLMDADLQNVDATELQGIIATVKEGCDADMVILRRLYADWFVKFNRGDVLLSGERIVKKSDLEVILQQPVEGFQLEMAINDYMRQQGKKVRWAPWSATNTYKMEKRGPVEGFIKDFQMYTDILRYVGIINFVRLVANFARKPLPMR